MQKRIWLPLALMGLAGVAVAIGLEPLVRRVVEKEAAQRGLVVEANSLSLVPGGIELEDVSVSLDGVPEVDIHLRKVRLRVAAFAPHLRAITVDGGQVQLRGIFEEVDRKLDLFRERHRRPSGEPNSASLEVRSDRVAGIDLTWHEAFGVGTTQQLSGMSFERGEQGQSWAVDLVRLQKDDLTVSLAGLLLEWSAPTRAGPLKTARAAEMRLSWRAEASPPAPARDLADTPAVLPPADDSEQGDARGLLDRLGIDRSRVARLGTLLSLVRERLALYLPERAEVSAITLALERGADGLQVGPQRLTVNRSAEAVSFELTPGELARGTPFALSGRVPRARDEALQVKLEGGPISLRALGVREGDGGLRRVAESTLSGSVRMQLSPDNEQLTVEGQVALDSLELQNEKLSPEPVAFPRLRLAGHAQMALDGSRYDLRDGELVLGEARFLGELSLMREANHARISARARAPLVSCQALVDSAPSGLLGAVSGIGLNGTFSLDTSVEADTRQLSKMAVHFDFKNDCKVRHVPETLDPQIFRGAFEKEVRGAGDVPVKMEFGPNTRSWTPYGQLPPFLESALLVTEDGRFFKHDGFDDRAIESSIRDNTKAGRFVRGASTLSMQLAKNLYLSRDKNLARKLQEVALTLLLEQSFDKRGLLELYLNVVEFGPGVYGVKNAALHYFATTPERLTAAQCFFLASILPAPTREYFAADGSLRPTRAAHIARLLQIARKRDHLSEVELQAALAEKIVFGQASTVQGFSAADESDPHQGSR